MSSPTFTSIVLFAGSNDESGARSTSADVESSSFPPRRGGAWPVASRSSSTTSSSDASSWSAPGRGIARFRGGGGGREEAALCSRILVGATSEKSSCTPVGAASNSGSSTRGAAGSVPNEGSGPLRADAVPRGPLRVEHVAGGVRGERHRRRSPTGSPPRKFRLTTCGFAVCDNRPDHTDISARGGPAWSLRTS